jgi:nucleoside-diphosphate-sugar epimerase
MARLPHAEPLPKCDLSDPHHAARLLSPFRWDAIVNVAGPAPRGAQTWEDDSRTIATHVRIAQNVARHIPPGRRLVHVSGMIVYGLPESLPVREEHRRRPIHAYGLAKVLAEDAFFGVGDAWLLRMGGLYSKERSEGALYHFLRAAKERRPIRLTATTPLAWDTIHVDDAAEAIARALDLPGEGPLNVSTGEPIELVGVARRIASRYGGTVEDVAGIVHPVFQADIARLESRFGWKPPPLDERIEEWWKTL